MSTKTSYIYTPENFIIPYVSLPEKLKEIASEVPEREAVIFWSFDNERLSITYFELYNKAELFAKGLLTFGLERNSIVVIANKNCPEWLIATFGTQMAGLIPLHFSFSSFSSEGIVNLISGIGNCSAMVIQPSNVELCKRFAEHFESPGNIPISTQLPTLKQIFLMKDSGDKYTSIDKVCKIGKSSDTILPYVSPDDICGIFLTSGSTGMAKAVPHTHRKMFHMGYFWGKLLHLNPGEKFYNDIPFSWQGSYPSMFIATKCTRVTATDILSLKSVDEINTHTLRFLEAERCVSAFLLTPCICDLLNKQFLNETVFPLRAVTTAGLPVDALCAQSIGNICKYFTVAYGCTEIGFVCWISVQSPKDYENYAVGWPVDGLEVKVVDEDGLILPVGQAGDIYARSRERFQGYLNAREKTEQCCDKTGWYKTDDVGYVKSDGSLVVTGRKSDMMIIGGDLVSPAYIESVLKQHESVVNAYVFPVKDKAIFQHAYAAVLLKKNQTVSEKDLTDFIIKQKGEYTESFLANRYVPKRIFFFESFPATHSGKLDRKALAEKIMKRT